MKFRISKEAFLDGLQKVQHVVSSRTTLPILSNVLLVAKDGRIQFTTTDLDVGITGSVEAQIEKEGATTLPAKRLVSIIRELPSSEVEVSVDTRLFGRLLRHRDGSTPHAPLPFSRRKGQQRPVGIDPLHEAVEDGAMAASVVRLESEDAQAAHQVLAPGRVAQELGLPTTQQAARPFLHISGMFPAERGCLAIMYPLATHPTNKNELLAWDLAHDPNELPLLDVASLRQRLFSKSADLPDGVHRLPVKSVHLNKSPMVVRNLDTLTAEMAARWNIDKSLAQAHATVARGLPDMSAIWAEVFKRAVEPVADVDEALYGGFIDTADRRRLDQLRMLPAAELAHSRTGFDDARLSELVFRYRARNFPATLNDEENQRWEAHRVARLLEGEGGARSVDALFAEIDTLAEKADEQGEAILGALYDYAEAIAPDL